MTFHGRNRLPPMHAYVVNSRLIVLETRAVHEAVLSLAESGETVQALSRGMKLSASKVRGILRRAGSPIIEEQIHDRA